jgi:hypothetical protein
MRRERSFVGRPYIKIEKYTILISLRQWSQVKGREIMGEKNRQGKEKRKPKKKKGAQKPAVPAPLKTTVTPPK